MLKRLITASILITIGLIAIYLNVVHQLPTFIIFAAILSIATTQELLNMFSKKKEYRVSQYIITHILQLAVFISLISQSLEYINVSLYAIVAFAILYLFANFLRSSHLDASHLADMILVVLFVAISFGSITVLALNSYKLLVFLLLVPLVTDAFAYFGGMLFGKHKLAPDISPKKTIEGAVIGTIFGSASGVIYVYVSKLDIINELPKDIVFTDTLIFIIITVLSVILSIMGQIGDLVLSKLKREYEIKDYGKIFPGHGGVLDRFDSVIFCSLTLFFITGIVELF